MNENRRLIIVGLVLLLVVGLILAITFWPKPDKSFICGVKADGDYNKLGSVNYKQYQCLIKQDKKNAIAVSSDLTAKKKEALNGAATKLGHALYYLNIDKIGDKDLKAIKKELNYQKDSFKEDVILVLNKGKVESFKEKILTSDKELKDFLKDADLAKFACDVQGNKEYENLGELTYEDYNCLYESDQTFVVMFSQTTCGYCMQFKPIINEYVGKNDIPFYFIEVNELSDSERSALLSSLSYFEDNTSWGTPLTLGVKNKEVITYLSGYTDNEEEIEAFFKTIGLK